MSAILVGRVSSAAVRPSLSRSRWWRSLGLALSIVLACACAGCRTHGSRTASRPASSEVDREYDAIWAAWRAVTDADAKRSASERALETDRRFRRFALEARAFAREHPGDPRRHELIVQSGYTSPAFLTGFKPGFEHDPVPANWIVDEAARAAFLEQQFALNEAVVLAKDATERQRGGAFVANLVEARAKAKRAGKPLDLAPFRALTDRAVREFGDERALVVVDPFVAALREQSAREADEYLAQLQSSAIGPALAARLERELRGEERAAEELSAKARGLEQLAFTAADGRDVDVRRLAGKVVLIDFWATWCAPCCEEIPELVSLQQKYAARGFELVGIALERAGILPQDAREVREHKLQAAREKLLGFTAARGMSWPQYFDGLEWHTRYAIECGIRAVPALFLLDRRGRLHPTDARGRELEAEIEQLLGN